MTDLTPTQPTTPSLTLNRALIIFIASLLAMIPGWLLAAYAPVWLAPPFARWELTFDIYMLFPCFFWGLIPIGLFRLWKIPLRKESLAQWVIRYALLVTIWTMGISSVFMLAHDDHMQTDRLFGTEKSCTSDHQANNVITYHCTVTTEYADECFNALIGCTHHYTFEGREGLPFVWYRGEFIPERNDDD